MTYSTLLFDLDHTLLDSEESERLAFEAALTAVDIGQPFDYFSTYGGINRALWAAVERQEIGPDDVRVARFEQLIDQTDLDVDPIAVADAFVAGLGAYGELYPECREVLDALGGRVTLALVTNGIGEVQRARIERLGLDNYFEAIAISGELGTSKPGTAIFDFVFESLEFPNKSEALMIGDSLASDIQGGNNFGIATCWYNPGGRVAGAAANSTYEIGRLREVIDLTTTR